MEYPSSAAASFGNTVLKNDMSRMLSTNWMLRIPYRPESSDNSARTRSADFERYVIPMPLRPQKVQCDFSPHQQPRELSAINPGSISSDRVDALKVSK